MHAGALPGTEAAPALAAGPGALDLDEALRNPVPELLRHDAERLVVTNHPLGLSSRDGSLLHGPDYLLTVRGGFDVTDGCPRRGHRGHRPDA